LLICLGKGCRISFSSCLKQPSSLHGRMRLKQPRIEKYAENMTFIHLNLVQGTLFKLKYGSHARLLSENVCAYNEADSNSVFHVQMWHYHEAVKIPVLSLISKRGNNLCSYSLTFLTVLLLINFQKNLSVSRTFNPFITDSTSGQSTFFVKSFSLVIWKQALPSCQGLCRIY